MFQKRVAIDKKKLLSKVLDLKKDPLTRLKYLRQLSDYVDRKELCSLVGQHFSFIYYTFIDTFSSFDCGIKQRQTKTAKEELDVILFVLEKILIFNAELIKKRWQFYSITFVMQKLLHYQNSLTVRQEGMRLFLIWYQIIADDSDSSLERMFASLVPNLIPDSGAFEVQLDTTDQAVNLLYRDVLNRSAAQSTEHHLGSGNIHPQRPTNIPIHGSNTNVPKQLSTNSSTPGTPPLSKQLSYPTPPIRSCTIEPMMPIQPSDYQPNDPISFYLECLLNYMVTQTTKIVWAVPDLRSQQERCFAFLFDMFKKVYLKHLFPDFNYEFSFEEPKFITSNNLEENRSESSQRLPVVRSPSSTPTSPTALRELGALNIHQNEVSNVSHSTLMQSDPIRLSLYQSIMIRWLTRFMRLDPLPGQDHLLGGQRAERSLNDYYYYTTNKVNENSVSSVQFHNEDQTSTSIASITQTNVDLLDASSKEFDIARTVAGTRPDNINVVHELFRQAFCNYYQPQSMKRVVNVYKEWICNASPDPTNDVIQNSPSKSKLSSKRIGYTNFPSLLQVFVISSSNAFVTPVPIVATLEEQVEMCKRIMNIYRFMVMKIYMNQSTWEQLLNVMMHVTQKLFSAEPPVKKETSIGGRIAPAFFQTFIVSWIRANLYVHIPDIFWGRFQRIMSSLIKWRELIEEWSTTMDSLTRVLVKHVYDLNLSDLPLERPLDRRRRPKNMKSFSTVETLKTVVVADSANLHNLTKQNSSKKHRSRNDQPSDTHISSKTYRIGSLRPETSRNLLLTRLDSTGDKHEALMSRITRSCSDGFLNMNKINNRFPNFYTTAESSFLLSNNEPAMLRKFRSEYLRQQYEAELFDCTSNHSRSPSPTHAIIDATSLKDSNLTLESTNHSTDERRPQTDFTNKNNPSEQSVNVERKCVLAGGVVRGWTQENSIIMWRRMLGLFGNLNQINDPSIHFVAMRCLAKILNDFIKTRENLGVSIDNLATPNPPTMVPPYTYFSTWLFQATYLPDTFKNSKLLAYKMICVSSIKRHDIELSPQYYSTLYQTLHRGLNSNDSDIRNVIIRYIGMLFSINLLGCTILAGDLVEACQRVILADRLEGPREEALQLLSSTLTLHRQIKKLQVLQPLQEEINLIACGDLRDRILSLLVDCDKLNNIEAIPKALSLCVLTNHIYQELSDKQSTSDLSKYVEVILRNVTQKNKLLCRTGCDMMRLLCDHATLLASTYPGLVRKSIKTLCAAIQDCYYNQNDNKESISSLLLCLGDWCFSAGIKFMLNSDDEDGVKNHDTKSIPILYAVMQTLESIVNDFQFRIQASTDDKATIIPKGNQGSENRFNSNHHSTDYSDLEKCDRNESTRNTSTEAALSSTNRSLIPDRNDLKFARLACRFLYVRLLNYLGHFPLKYLGATSLSCCIEESEYLQSEQESDFQNAENLCIFVVNDTTIVSFIGVTTATKNSNVAQDLSSQSSNSMQSEHNTFQVHIIVRDLCGKYAWECRNFKHEGHYKSNIKINSDNGFIILNPKSFRSDVNNHHMIEDMDEDGHDETSTDDLSASSSSSRNRDYLEGLINQLCHCLSSDEVSISSPVNGFMKKRNSAQSISNPKCKIGQAEEIMIALLTNQRFQELNHCDDSESYDQTRLCMNGCYSNRSFSNHCSKEDMLDQQRALPFEKCRQLIEQLGYMAWEKRAKIDMLMKNGRLLRELRNLDKQAGRETHKIAVIYVANGQEDKTSILTNSTGSRAFEDFVAGLGWEVNLANHLGFKGGLQTNKSTGETSPYYCNSSTEVMFHVSTRIPFPSPTDEESLNRKLRHLGNDEIHIVWSEHNRDYRRGIIPTEFGDVIIVVYPLQTFIGFFRIQILCKSEVPYFGPLFDNSIVHQSSLSPLVRATAINASRAKRFKIPFFQSHFEERSKAIETIVQNQKERLPFEDFASKLYLTSSSYMKKYQDKAQSDANQCCPSPSSEKNRTRLPNQQIERTTANLHTDID